MKNEQDLLQKLYDSTISQTDPWYFFLNLADYVKFVEETSPFKEVAEALKKEKEAFMVELEKQENKSIEELLASKEKLQKLVASVKGLPEKLKREGFFSDGFTSIDMYMEDKLHTSGATSDVISRYLYDISWAITENGEGKILDGFTVSNKGNHREVAFSDTLKKRQDLSDELNTQRSLSPWGYWDFLSFVKENGIFVWSDWSSQFPKVDQTYLSEFVSVKHEVQENKPPENKFPRIERPNRTSTRESRVPTYKHYLERIHLYLLKQTTQFSNKPIEEGKRVSFDPDLSILKIGKKEVRFRRFTDQYHTLRILFEDKKETKLVWFFSEIAEKTDAYKKFKDKNFHNQFSAIKRKISADTGIKDLFMTTTQSVKINDKYFR